jgi:hypothetical protein
LLSGAVERLHPFNGGKRCAERMEERADHPELFSKRRKMDKKGG